MAGTKEGGKQAQLTNKLKYGDDFYKIIGQKGGKISKHGGFYYNKELARIAGKLGGSVSRKPTADGIDLKKKIKARKQFDIEYAKAFKNKGNTK